MLPMARTALCVEDCTSAICVAMMSVALAVCTASALTSEATTAKPLPAAPARAASMVALSANRLVCPATLWMSLMTSSIFCAATARPSMSALVDCASAVAARTTSVARASWWLISAIDFDISSAALAAISTLSNASPDVLTAPAVCVVVSLEIADSADAIDRQAAGFRAQPNDIRESRARLHDIRRQIVDFQVAVVANDEARMCVEHHD